jgi:hypothetical protein
VALNPPRKTLPAGANRANIRDRLEQIAQAKSSPKQLTVQCEKIVWLCDNLARALLKMAAEIDLDGLSSDETALSEQLTRRGDDARKQAATYRQIGKVERPHFLRQCELLWLSETIGGDLSITTPHKPRDEATWPSPRGPVIDYFQAAAKAVFGKTPTPGQIKVIVSDYRHLNFSAAQLSSGADLRIGESGIFILRDGKRID